MAVRAGDVPALRGSAMVKGPADSAATASFYVCYKVATACALARAVRYQGHLWLVSLPLVEATPRLTPSALCPDNPGTAALFEANPNLVEQVQRLATPSLLGSAKHARGVPRCSRELTPEGVLQFREGMHHEDLPNVSGFSLLERVLLLDPRLEEEGPLPAGFGQELYGSGAAPGRPTSVPDAGRARPPPSRAGWLFPGQMFQMP